MFLEDMHNTSEVDNEVSLPGHEQVFMFPGLCNGTTIRQNWNPLGRACGGGR